MIDPLANALIFIPDISGFSHFVKDTEISHSQHIIEELLEEIIDANSIGLEISEIEGDAILFYKDLNQTTSLADVIKQVEQMYNRFHTHLKMYEHQRICQCGACTTANDLSIKFIIHNGPVSFNSVRGHDKLFGEHVIEAHRLLKNEITVDEYAIFSSSLVNYYNSLGQELDDSLSSPQLQTELYDIGEISYSFCDLVSLSSKVPDPQIEKFGLKGKSTRIDKTEHLIKAPLEMVFNVLTDYTIRHNWSNDIQDSADINSFIARNGSSHRCVLKNGRPDPFFNAHDFKVSSRKIVFQETEQKIGISNVYELESSGEYTKVYMTNSLKGGPFKALIFKWFALNKLKKSKDETFSKIEEFCHELINSSQTPKQQVVLSMQSIPEKAP